MGRAFLRAHRSLLSFVSVAAFTAISAGFGCGKSAVLTTSAPTEDSHPIRFTHEPCDINSPSAVKYDADANGRPEVISVMKDGQEICRMSDVNQDGRVDRFVYFDEAGKTRRIEADWERDGRMDEVTFFKDGVIFARFWDMSLDGRLDTWQYFENGRMVKQDRDANGDGRVDEWWTFADSAHPECALVIYDRDSDGRADPGSQEDTCHPQTEENQGFDPNAPPPGASAAPSTTTSAKAPTPPPAASASAAPAASK